ncbi:hypothetical protein [Paraburkholderia sp. Ac-20340]|uniref:hypothetical protein n=1 Tax=Paraburkholderia sp. Ac-20340 TaxID=2703888 RepID=UPI00198155CB|nr:hypothetical protein [Paraburkholderia sp. Ac-20340]
MEVSLFFMNRHNRIAAAHTCRTCLDVASRFVSETTVHKLDNRKRIFSRGERLLYYIERHVSHWRCLMSGFCHTTGQSVVSGFSLRPGAGAAALYARRRFMRAGVS